VRTTACSRVAIGLVLAWIGLWVANRSQFKVAGWSMAPTLWPGDRLLTLAVPTALARRALRAGQLVVVVAPDGAPGRDHLVVKRIAAIDARGIDVRGDDPDHSTDSRTWGPVPASAVRAVVFARWPDLRTPLRRTHSDE
jgi:nickel-type superoxide dismutase maturation protease